MASFHSGSAVELEHHKTAYIKAKIGEGGQGSVYLVTVDGEDYALKWYHRRINNGDKFYRNLAFNIDFGSPSDLFVWPKFLSLKTDDGEYGYVMDLLPERYKCFSDFLLTKEKFSSITVVINAALNITNAFRELHRKGFSYQDLNDGNFFIDPDTGDVLICDTDNVAPYGDSLGIAGKARYMAPEVVRSIKAPDVMTDRFSLAVILFRLLFLDHPLEGRRTLCPCMTEELEQKFYGKYPLFIYDPFDDTNIPVRGVHCNVIRIWPLYPQFVRDMFIKAFSQQCLKMEAARPTDNEWQIMFTRLRDCVVKCPCGGETFLNLDEEETECVNCKMKIPRPPILLTKKYRVALFPGNKIYKCHTREETDNYTDVTGSVIRSQNRPGVWGIKNLSGNTWYVTTRNGEIAEVPNGKVVVIMKADTINFGNCSGKIEINRQ
ncbi:MAG: serine/threonine protein kinase [Clostridia bacterium]|nr:serine/threonine protein kinase [Clostridia bacterium]